MTKGHYDTKTIALIFLEREKGLDLKGEKFFRGFESEALKKILFKKLLKPVEKDLVKKAVFYNENFD